jgi:hypothetical protein
MGVEERAQRGQRARLELAIGVEQKHVPALRFAKAMIRSRSETLIDRRAEDPRSFLGKVLQRRIGRTRKKKGYLYLEKSQIVG